MLKKLKDRKKESSAAISRVLFSARWLSVCHLSNPTGHPAAQAFYPPSSPQRVIRRATFLATSTNDGIHELAASSGHSPPITRRLVVSYTHLLTLTFLTGGGCFLLPSPAVTDSFHFQKWSTLCCPDFPLAQKGQRQTATLLSRVQS